MPILIRVKPDIFAALPGYVRGVVVAIGIDNRGGNSNLAELLEHTAADACRKPKTIDPRIANFDGAHRRFASGRIPPLHIDLLRKSIATGGRLPFINKLSAIMNYNALLEMTPVYVDDPQKAGSQLELRRAHGDEGFARCGCRNGEEYAKPGEFIYVNFATNKIVRRYWNARGSNLGAVDESTTEAIVSIDGVGENAMQATIRIADRISAMIRQYCGASVRATMLTASCPDMTSFATRDLMSDDPARHVTLQLYPLISSE